MSSQYEVIIIGAGPSGLAAARSLLELGIKNVLLLERESEAGGVPRHCRHPTFGIQTYFRPMNGHNWAARILKLVQGKYEIRTSTTVVNIKPGGELEVSSDRGLETLHAKRVIIATGVRETPRHARLISGQRPQGVLTAGALQQFIYLKKLKPGIRPVIVGSELVSFSAIWTLRNAGIKALALIDENSRPVAFKPASGQEHLLTCDSIIFTGRFTGEYTLIRKSHLQFQPETGRPLFDQNGRCSDPSYFAVGNMTHPADMGDQCYQEGQRVGRYVARTLSEQDIRAFKVPVILDDVFRIAAPNVISCGNSYKGEVTLNVRVEKAHTGEIVVTDGSRELYRKKHRCMPERRILLKHIDVSALTPESILSVKAV